MAEETPKMEQTEATTTTTAPPGVAAADVVASAKVFAEAAETAVIKQAEKVKDRVVESADTTKTNVVDKSVDVKDKVVGTGDTTKTNTTEQGGNIKDKVVGAVGGMLEATKTGVVQCVDKAQSYLSPSSATTTTDPASPAPAAEDKKE